VRHFQPIADWRDEEIARLKRALNDTRYDLLNLVRSDIADDLKFPRLEIKTRDELWEWRRKITAKAIELAKPNEHGRAPCPLCGEERSPIYAIDAGYLVPGGLRSRPTVQPGLFKKEGWEAERNRTPEELVEAEAKLDKVGFKKEITGNVVSYCLTQGDDWMVLADPRERGKVTFHICKRSGKKAWKGLKKYPRSFDVRDNRKDWSGVFREGLGEFTGRAK
jgi:hypothetical protein